MILTDHDLSDLIANHDLIQNDTYDPDCVTNIGYDLRSKAFFDENGEQHTKILTPGESVMVSAEEIIHMPDNMAAIVQGRNSRIRQGTFRDSTCLSAGACYTGIFSPDQYFFQ